jgi:hypothetical protein
MHNLARQISRPAIEVRGQLGPGLLESVYEYCLVSEMDSRGTKAAQQVSIPVKYKGRILALLHLPQLLSYVRVAGFQLGLLIQFNDVHFKDGIRRVVNELIG